MTFEKGQSGNPASRPAGSRNKTAAEGSELSKLVDHYLRALEAKDFEQRLHMLEGEPPKDRGKPDDAF